MASLAVISVLALAGAALAGPHVGHGHAHLHARDDSWGSSTSTAAPSASDFPSCWATCFKSSGVESRASLCSNSKVINCIKDGCSNADAAEYEKWLVSYCGSSTTSSVLSAVSTSAPYPYPSGNSTVGPTGTGTAYSSTSGIYTSVCTETSTNIYRTTTVYSTYQITHTYTASAPGYTSATGVATGATGASSGTLSVAGATSTGEECSLVTVTTTEVSTVTVTAGEESSSGPSTVYVTSTYTIQPSPYASSSSSSPAAPVSSSSSSPAAAVSTSTAPAPVAYSSTTSVAVAPTSTVAASSWSSTSSAAVQAADYPSSAETSTWSAVTSATSAAGYSTTASATSTASASSGLRAKGGVAYNDISDVVDAFFESSNIGWSMNWVGSSGGISTSEVPYIPTLHAGTSEWTDNWNAEAAAGIAAGAPYLFSFNEPDNPSQANMNASYAADLWKVYMEPFAGQAKLCAPSVTNAAPGTPGMGLDWLTEFLDSCTGCTIDCVNQHWYDTAGNDISYFQEQVTDTMNLGYPTFVGEFGFIGDDDEISSALSQVMSWMDGESGIVGYAYFMAAPGILTDSSGTALSSIGETYTS